MEDIYNDKVWNVIESTTNSSWVTTTTDGKTYINMPDGTNSNMNTITINPESYWTTGSVTYTMPQALGDDEEAWPKVDDAIGIVFIQGNEIKLMKKDGEEVVVGRLDDSKDFTPLEVVAVKMKLTEEENSVK